MRLTDLDKLKSDLENIGFYIAMHDLFTPTDFVKVCETINKQPEAYDVDKVVEELLIACHSNDSKNIKLNDAIEIVRRGGVHGKV